MVVQTTGLTGSSTRRRDRDGSGGKAPAQVSDQFRTQNTSGGSEAVVVPQDDIYCQ